MKSIKIGTTIFLIVIVALCAILFMTQNGEQVRVNLFSLSSPEQPMWVWILGGIFSGIIITLLASSLGTLKYKSKIKKQGKEIGILQKEIHSLRSQPVDALPTDQPNT